MMFENYHFLNIKAITKQISCLMAGLHNHIHVKFASHVYMITESDKVNQLHKLIKAKCEVAKINPLNCSSQSFHLRARSQMKTP